MTPSPSSKNGGALIIVMCLCVLAAAIAAQMAVRTGGQVVRDRRLVQMEQSFYIAEGAAERAASYIAGGGAVPTTLTGSLGSGTYHTLILVEAGGGGLVGSLAGSININPNNSPDNSFLAVLPDGSQITRDDLHDTMPDYEGAATMILVRPKGSGSQSLTVNGSSYTINNNNTYSFSGTMQVRIYNDARNPQGRATGQWWLEVNSASATVSSDETAQMIRRDTRFTIQSTGRVGDSVRSVMIRGLQTVSWAKYAFWYNNESVTLWITGGERFEGPVYANTQFRFHSYQVNTLGQTHFLDTASSTASSIQKEINSVNPIFDKGLTLNAPVQTMATVDFNELLNDASFTLDGPTSIRISGRNVYITNTATNWSNHRIDLPDDGLIYVRTSTITTTTGTGKKKKTVTTTYPGDLTVTAPDGVNGRLTLVADEDVLIADHIRYASNPIQNTNSTDAIGLIAGRHAVVTTDAPNNLDIFAHIICRDGGFGVDDYSNTQRGPRGMLNVYGGIVNYTRNPVGTTSGGGYSKNYIYDQRFRRSPPPRYPALPDEFQWLGWDG